MTSAPGLLVAGDLAYGAKLLIHAVASGKRVARSVYQALTGREIGFRDIELHFPIAGYETILRAPTRTTPVAERIESQLVDVEIGLSEEEARREASRCLDCGVNTIFDARLCVACGGCVDVCPEACLFIVPVAELEGGRAADGRLGGGLEDLPSGALSIIRDETICIRCGMCADRCPVGAISRKRFRFASLPLVS